jgi:hypothetical protein
VTAVTNPDVKLLAPNKIAVVVPSGVSVVSNVFKYAVCAFASNSANAALIASGSYTVGTRPTIDAVSGVAPVSGPALGGTSITVTGTGFVANTATVTNTRATLDGQPLTNITVNQAGTSFSAETPAHAAGGPFLLSITTPGGTTNTLAGTTTKANLFSYSNGIVVSPNTAANHRGDVDVDVLGVGFANMSFDATNGNTPSSANAHVYLTRGAYDEEDSSGGKTVPQQTECINVLVISDGELLCTLPLNHTYDNVAAPAFTASAARTALNGTTVNTSKQITSTDAAFTQNDVGLPISGTGIPAGNTITAVASPTSATMNAAASASATVADVSVGGPRAAAGLTAWGAATVAAGGRSITGGTGFTKADIGRVISSVTAAWPANTTIVSVGNDGATATVSAAGTPGAVTNLVVTPSVPVTDGTYTLTVVSNGAVDARDTSPATYSQSIVSSGSTFTVAEY